MSIQKINSGLFYKLCGFLLITVTVMLYPNTLKAENEAMPCRGLKPYQNIEDLLYQFYINLDSDCLFKMSVPELEKIWETKIQGDRVEGSDKSSQPSDFYLKPYQSEKDAFFISIRRREKTDLNEFTLFITKEYDLKYATLFPNGNFPKFLPRPLERTFDRMLTDLTPKRIERLKKAFQYSDATYQYGDLDSTEYYWLNSDRSRIIILKGADFGVGLITVTDKVHDIYINEEENY